MGFRTIVVPIDTTPLSDRAIDTACDLARAFGAQVHVVWVRPLSADPDETHPEIDVREVEREHHLLVETALERARRHGDELSGRVFARVRGGDPVAAIVETVDDVGADCVVMGTHGRRGLDVLVGGSTTERVMMRTPATVVVVKPVGFPYHMEE